MWDRFLEIFVGFLFYFLFLGRNIVPRDLKNYFQVFRNMLYTLPKFGRDPLGKFRNLELPKSIFTPAISPNVIENHGIFRSNFWGESRFWMLEISRSAQGSIAPKFWEHVQHVPKYQQNILWATGCTHTLSTQFQTYIHPENPKIFLNFPGF